MRNLTGMRFGKLIAVEMMPRGFRNKRYRYWRCRCDCGNETFVRTSRLTAPKGDRTTSCGCKKSHKFMPEMEYSNAYALISRYMEGAKRRGHSWELTELQALSLFAGVCYYCGVSPSSEYQKSKNYPPFVHNGIDRLDPAIGYTVSNSVSCCSRCNYMKQGMTEKEFLDAISAIHVNLLSK